MQEKELHKLGKTDLLTIIYEQEKRIEQLQEEINDLNKKLEDRTITIQEAGSIADASMKLNKIFEMAQQAADDYLKSVKEVNKSSQEYVEINENITNEENTLDTNDDLLNDNILELDKDISNINKEEVGGLILVNKSLMVKKPKLLKRIIVFLIQIFSKIPKLFTNAKFKFKEFKSKISKEKEIKSSVLKLKKKEKQSKSRLKPKKQTKIALLKSKISKFTKNKTKKKLKKKISKFIKNIKKNLKNIKKKVANYFKKKKKNKKSKKTQQTKSTDLKVLKKSDKIIAKIRRLLVQLKENVNIIANAIKKVCEKSVKRLKKILSNLKKCDIISPTFGKAKNKIVNLKTNKKELKEKSKKEKPTLKLAKKNKFDASQVKISIVALEKELKKRKAKANKLKFVKTISASIIVIIAICIIAATQFFNVLQVSGNSMEPNLYTGELLITSKFFKFEKGDMIAFYYNDAVLIKRIIATGGDVVYIDDNGVVYVNSVKLEENYVKELSYGICDITYPYQVPENEVFILGDNREVSIDSRSKSIGCISSDKIIGKIMLKLNPFVIY